MTPSYQRDRVLVEAMGHDPCLLRVNNETRRRHNPDDKDDIDITFPLPTKRKLSEELSRAVSSSEDEEGGGEEKASGQVTVKVEATSNDLNQTTRHSCELEAVQSPKRRHFDTLVSTDKH